MDEPALTDYVTLIYNLFERFVQQSDACAKRGHPYVYQNQSLIVFFMMMQFRRIYQFKTQWRWLKAHPERHELLGFKSVPHRTTLLRRYKALYSVLQDFIAFLGRYAEALDERFESHDLYEDKSLFKARGPVWHQSDRKAGRIPDKLRNLDTDATWSKSGYHGWVYGYGMHLTCNSIGFPKLVEIETAALSEKHAMNSKEEAIFNSLRPFTLTGDNGYTQALRIRRWASLGIALLTPAFKWVKGRYAQAYHLFIQHPDNAELLRRRRTAIEPIFDLFSKIMGTTDNHKQLSLQRLPNVRTCLALAVLSLQIAMLVNSIWSLPLRSISTIGMAFS